ncbi:hypothetical protein ACFLSQ_02395 [Bacteroidota bacterium]
MKLDEYEKDILDSVEKDEWQQVKDIKSIKTKLRLAAKSSLENFDIDVILSPEEIFQLKQRSKESGISLQLLMTRLIRDYTSGKVHLDF